MLHEWKVATDPRICAEPDCTVELPANQPQRRFCSRRCRHLAALARQRIAYREGPGRDKVYAKSLKRLYGITLTQYEGMVETQDGRCAICGERPEERLRVDHDHATGELRQLLCNLCNVALANARDNPDLLRAMIAYLERHQPPEA
jgi:Recombination endonuclease VII